MAQQKKRILCVEDDREVAALLAEDLSARGYAVSLVHDGRAALASLAKDAPDLIVCDVLLPSMSGFEVLQRVTEMPPRLANIPFIFLTALAERESEIKGRSLGADDYVAKPVDFEILASIIRTRLARAGRLPASMPAVDLTAREAEALTWSARGKTSAEIAQIVGLTKGTIDAHLDLARAKLGASTRTEAVVKAIKARLIKL